MVVILTGCCVELNIHLFIHIRCKSLLLLFYISPDYDFLVFMLAEVFSVLKATLESQMSICTSVCHKKTLSITDHNYWPPCLSATMPISHHSYHSLCLFELLEAWYCIHITILFILTNVLKSVGNVNIYVTLALHL